MEVGIPINDSESSHRASRAIRDILYLYRDLTAYGGGPGDNDTGEFDAWSFLRCHAEGGWATEEDVRLLQQGSAVALLVTLSDVWSQGGGDEQSLRPFRVALESGAFDHLPVAKAAVSAGLEGEEQLFRAFPEVWRSYVVTYLGQLADEAKRTS